MTVNPRAVVQKVHLAPNDLKFIPPCTMSFSGPSQIGKSQLMAQFVEYRKLLFDLDTDFHRIIYSQPEVLAHRPNPIFEKIQSSFPTAELCSGLPDISKLQLDLNSATGPPSLVIVDDQMTQFLDSSLMVDLMTIKSHHHNISIWISLQNYFCSSKHGKTIMRNISIKVFFYNRLDLTELKNISSQIVPKNPNFLESCFNFLFRKFPNDPSHYILVDGKSKARSFFVRSRILPEKDGYVRPIIFFPK